MGNFTPRDALKIGIALLIISFVYSLLSLYFVPKVRSDPAGGMLALLTNIGFATASFILILVGLFFIILGMLLNKDYRLDL